MIKKDAEKILKYKDFTIEIQRTWNVRRRVLPVIAGASGTVSKSLRQCLRNMPRKHEIKEPQKQPYLALHTHTHTHTNTHTHTHTLREVLMQK